MTTEKTTVYLDINGKDARAELKRLEAIVKSITADMAEIARTEGAASPIYDSLAKKLKTAETNLAKYKAGLQQTDVIIKNLSSASIPELQKAQKALEAQINSGAIARNSEEWNTLNKKLYAVKEQINFVRMESEKTQIRLEKVLANPSNTTEKNLRRIKSWLEKAISGTKDGSAKWEDYTKALHRVNTELDKIQSKKTQQGVNVKTVMGNLSASNLYELQHALKAVNAELNSPNIKAGSDRWKELNEQSRKLKAQIQALNEEGRNGKSWIDRFNDGMNQWQTTIAASIAAIAGLYQGLVTLRDFHFQKEDAASKVQAITGLSDESVKWLEEKAIEMSTTMDETGMRIRQSAHEIMDAFRLVGSNKPELLQDKEGLEAVTREVLRLSQAANMDLTNAALAVTTALNQYGQGADKARKYVNALAAGSKYGAADVQNISKVILRAGVAANLAHIPFEQLVGATETLAGTGLKGERAGTQLKTFLLRLETGAKETRPSVVGLNEALEKLAEKGSDTTFLKKSFGMVAVNVAKTLIENREELKRYTAAVTATNVAEEQAAIMGRNNVAAHEQLKNKIKEMGDQLYQKIGPAILGTTAKMVHWGMYLRELIKFLIDHRNVITALIVQYGLLTLAINANNIATSLAVLKFTLLRNAIILARNAQLLFNLALKANPVVWIASGMMVLIAAMKDYSRNTERSYKSTVERINAEEKIQKVREKIKQLNYEESVSLSNLRKEMLNHNTQAKRKLEIYEKLKKTIPGYTVKFDQFGNVLKENTKAFDEYIKKIKNNSVNLAYEQEYTRIENLRERLNKENISREQKLGIIRQLQKIIPGYNAELSKEGKVIRENTKSLEDYIAMKKHEMLSKAIEEEEGDLWEQRYKVATKLEGTLRQLENLKLDKYFGIDQSVGYTTDQLEKLAEGNKATAELAKIAWEKELKEIDDAIEKLYEEAGMAYEKAKKKFSNKNSDDTSDEFDDMKEAERRKAANLEKEKAEKRYNEKRVELAHQFHDGMYKDEADYQNALRKLEEEELKEYADIWKRYMGANSKEYISAQNDILKARQKAFEAGRKQQDKEFNLDDFKKRLETLIKTYVPDKKFMSEEELLEQGYQIGLVKYEEYLAAKNGILERKRKEAQQLIQKYNPTENYEADLDAARTAWQKKLMTEEEFIAIVHEIKLKEHQFQMKLMEKEAQKARQESGRKIQSQRMELRNNLKLLEQHEQSEKDLLLRKKLENKISEEEYQESLQTLNENYASQRKITWSNFYKGVKDTMQIAVMEADKILSTIGSTSEAIADFEVKKVEKKYDDLIKLARKNKRDTTKLEKEKEEEINKIKKKEAIKQQKIAIAQAVLDAAKAMMKTHAQYGSTPVGIAMMAIDAALSTMQIAAIKKQTQAEIALYYEGGYTRGTNYRKEAGIVHEGEFVANHESVNSPVIRPVLDLVDKAQRNNAVGRITKEDIALASNYGVARGFDRGGYTTPVINVDVPTIKFEQNEMYNKLYQLLSKMEDDGIRAYTFIEDKYGIREQMKKANKIISNKNR